MRLFGKPDQRTPIVRDWFINRETGQKTGDPKRPGAPIDVMAGGEGNKQVAALIEHADETQWLKGVVGVVMNNDYPAPYMAYLVQGGHVNPACVVAPDALKHLEFSSEVWARSCEIATLQARKEQVLMTPMLGWLFDHITAVSTRGGSPPRPGMPLGPGMKEAFDAVADFTKTSRDRNLVEKISKYSIFKGVIAEYSPLVASLKGVMLEAFRENLGKSLKNPYAGPDSVASLTREAIRQISRGVYSGAKTESLREFFEGLKKHGRQLDQHQLSELVMITDVGLDVNRDYVALCPQAVANDKIRARLLCDNLVHDSERLQNMLESAQGKVWLDLKKLEAAAIISPPAYFQGRKTDRRAEISDWNLEGLTRQDLVFLNKNKNKRVREDGMKAMQLVGERDKKIGSVPGPPR